MRYFIVLLALIPVRINYEPSMELFNSPHAAIKPVSETPIRPMRRLEQDIQCMADNIYYEAAGEPIEGKIAVAQVVINRTHSRFYPHTVCGVVYDHAQFSWTLHKRKHKNARDYRKAEKLAVAILTKKLRSAIIGTNVIFYHNDKITPPSWTENSRLVAVIGNHLFYARTNL